jgi:hypothetical protein
MRNIIKIIALMACTLAVPGCLATTRGHVGGSLVVYSDPPPPRVVVVEPRPGYIWIDGVWIWSSGQWVWTDGYWEVERPGYVYVTGYWERRGSRHVWVKPYWKHGHGRSGVVVRDHRRGDGDVKVKARPGDVKVKAKKGKGGKRHKH